MALLKTYPIVVIIAFILTACTDTSSKLGGPDLLVPVFSDEIESSPWTQLAEMMVGTFQTRPDDEDNNFTDRRIALPGLGERLGEMDSDWLYYQINRGADNSVYRQRVIQLKPIDDKQVTQLTWTFHSPEDFVDLWDKPQAIATLSEADLKPSFNTGCEQNWVLEGDAWRGEVDPDTCHISSQRRGRKIAIGARARLSADRLLQSESGYELDGTYIWGSRQGEFITLERAN